MIAKRVVKDAAAIILCLLIPTAGAVAQQIPYETAAAPPLPPPVYQVPAPPPLFGTYRSDAFYPGPLTLTISGIDAAGNLSGSMSGWSSTYIGGETGDSWNQWQHVFGPGGDGTRASYRDGRITIVFPNHAAYVLDQRGNELDGAFAAGTENRPISFIKSYGLAAR